MRKVAETKGDQAEIRLARSQVTPGKCSGSFLRKVITVLELSSCPELLDPALPRQRAANSFDNGKYSGSSASSGGGVVGDGAVKKWRRGVCDQSGMGRFKAFACTVA